MDDLWGRLPLTPLPHPIFIPLRHSDLNSGSLYQVQLENWSFPSGETPLLDLDQVYTKSSSKTGAFPQAKLHCWA